MNVRQSIQRLFQKKEVAPVAEVEPVAEEAPTPYVPTFVRGQRVRTIYGDQVMVVDRDRVILERYTGMLVPSVMMHWFDAQLRFRELDCDHDEIIPRE